MSTFRSTSTPRPVHAIVARKASRTMANSGVKSRVSTGAMFSMTLCFASTSQDADDHRPDRARTGSATAPATRRSSPMASNIIIVKAVSTPPPSAMST